MNVKIKKTLYIPDWIAELLDAEYHLRNKLQNNSSRFIEQFHP